MTQKSAVPIVVGVTGHRQIREQDRAALEAAVRAELKKLKKLCPHSPLVMLNSLAEGADLLCADAAEALGVGLIAVLPRPRADYEQDFSEAGLARFAHHCERAEQVFVAPPAESPPPSGGERAFGFRQAGIYVAAHSHVLLALWDGEPGAGQACGTADTVDFALKGSYAPRTGLPLRSSDNAAVVHILCPRGEQTGAAGSVQTLGGWERVRELLRKTEDFNRLARGEQGGGESRFPAPVTDDPALGRMEKLSIAAGRLSRRYAKRYRLVLALLAASSALLTLAFLLYDEAQATWMILVCGLMLLAAFACQRYAARSNCHCRYLEFRALAELLRVQSYLRYAGSPIRAAELLTWSQQEETPWIMLALLALCVGGAPETRRDIRDCWVEAQRSYHESAGERSGRDLARSERVVHIALLLSISLYLAAVLFELLLGGLFFRPLLRLPDPELYRTALKIILGAISALTLFIANYYGRLSLPRTQSDHRKMARFYAKMGEAIRQRGQTDELLTLLARVELTENGNWCSYQRDNQPDISL